MALKLRTTGTCDWIILSSPSCEVLSFRYILPVQQNRPFQSLQIRNGSIRKRITEAIFSCGPQAQAQDFLLSCVWNMKVTSSILGKSNRHASIVSK